MNCNQAKQQIDKHVQAVSENDEHTASESSELRDHLSACAACAKEYQEIVSVRGRLAELSEDAPSDAELQNMWRAISPAITSQSVDDELASRTRRARRVLRYAAIITSIAAVLMVSFRMGQWRYREIESPLPTSWFASKSAARKAVKPNSPAVTQWEDEEMPAQEEEDYQYHQSGGYENRAEYRVD